MCITRYQTPLPRMGMARSTSIQRKIPVFDSVEEEAHFWDTHDSGEFEDEFEPVEVEDANPLGHVFLLRLDVELLGRLQAGARQAGVDLSTYERSLLRDGLERSEQSIRPTD